MKLTTPEQKLIEAAKLDGWTMHKVYPYVMCFYEGKKLIHESNIDAQRITRYSTSYDAILPLIQKCFGIHEENKDLNYDLMEKFWDELNDITDFFEVGGNIYMLSATPSQLLDALLLAHGHEIV